MLLLLDDLILSVRNDFSNSINYLNSYSGTDYKQYIKVNDYRYNRIRIFKNEDIEIFIITWNISQKANIHYHSENGCYLKVLEGSLEESVYVKDNDNVLCLKEKNVLKENDISYMDNKRGFHSIQNVHDDITVTIHIYSPPNHVTKFY